MYFMLRERRFNIMMVNLNLSQNGVQATSVINIYNKGRLPFYLQKFPLSSMHYMFDYWLKNRMIPKDRENIINTVRSLSLTDPSIPINTYGMCQLMGILSMARNMTDKYNLIPLRGSEEEKKEYAIHLPEYIGLSRVSFSAPEGYKGQDFFINGFAKDFSQCAFTEIKPKEHAAYNTPDFCTNGKVAKCWCSEEDGFFLEKRYKDFDKDKLRILNDARADFPEYFPEIKVSTENFMPVGYKAKAHTDQFTKLVTFREFCEGSDRNAVANKDELERAALEYGMEIREIRRIRKAYDKYAKPFGLKPSSFYDNAGVIVDTENNAIERMCAWL